MKQAAMFMGLVLVVGCAPTVGNARVGATTMGMRHPEMQPSQGTAAAPMGEVGAAVTPETMWSATTYEAAVNHVPEAATVRTVTGEVIDLSCYTQLGKHGAAHVACAQNCARQGEPIGLITRTGEIWVLMAEEHHARRDGRTRLRAELVDHRARHDRARHGDDDGLPLFVQGFGSSLLPISSPMAMTLTERCSRGNRSKDCDAGRERMGRGRSALTRRVRAGHIGVFTGV